MSADGYWPHKFPAGAPDEVLGWECAACGEWVSEMSRGLTNCPINWRAASESAGKAEET